MSQRIRIEPSGHEFSAEAGESVLDAALRAGHALPYSCRSGLCGSCMGTLVNGEVEYPDGEPPALGADDRAAGRVLCCQAVPRTDVTVRARVIEVAGDLRPRVFPCRVLDLERLAPDVMRMRLRLPGDGRLQFLAGQYLQFLLEGGRRRSFSLANAPHDDESIELHIRHVPDGWFTGRVFESLAPKAILRAEGPFGTFFLRPDDPRPRILMAGGTGFAPIKAMVEDALHRDDTRPIDLYWGARDLRDLYLHELAQEWAERHGHIRYVAVLSAPGSEADRAIRRGWVHEAVLADYPDLSGHSVYMSGPPPMIQAARHSFAAAGLDEVQLFFDSFEFSEDSAPR
ncbi:MAG: CDP-6-deoxy-delta-3,4-glucoseen reductase [Chromatiales bacterium]|nr:CDP-6-deoxy-delta-3,4-glucoseen reductase [Chromatiales bacterium]